MTGGRGADKFVFRASAGNGSAESTVDGRARGQHRANLSYYDSQLHGEQHPSVGIRGS